MRQFLRVLLPVVLFCGIATVILPGCGGGSSGLSSQGSVADYQGNYAGTYTGLVQPGLEGAGSTVGGTFTATIAQDGTVTGTVTQPGAGTFPASGTVDRNGNVVITAPSSATENSTLTGKITNRKTGALAGTFTTTSGGVKAVVGTFEGALVVG